MLNIRPVTLEGTHVKLVPMQEEHSEALFHAGHFAEIWTYMSAKIESLEDAQILVADALKARADSKELPFTVIHKASGSVVGSTRFLNIARNDMGLEIGWTWYTPSVWRTAVNTECKWLLLRHCFEELGCVRVQLKTDSRNVHSQRAIARIGGVKEGTLRKHMLVRNGFIRDSVYFSIIDNEWPEVNRKLQAMLDRR